jgi:hypothetical protein
LKEYLRKNSGKGHVYQINDEDIAGFQKSLSQKVRRHRKITWQS